MFGINWKPFNSEEETAIVEAITVAEKQTSGEIRVHVDRYCKTDPFIKGRNQFVHLQMEQTSQKNAVLIYVSLDDHCFAIVGDEGIDKVVGNDFWDSTRDKMQQAFKANNVVEGICVGVKEAGEQLKHFFPIERGDENELPNTITYG